MSTAWALQMGTAKGKTLHIDLCVCNRSHTQPHGQDKTHRHTKQNNLGYTLKKRYSVSEANLLQHWAGRTLWDHAPIYC